MEKNILKDSSSITPPVAALPLATALLVGWLGLLTCPPGASAQTVGFIAVTNAAGYSQDFDRMGSSASSTNIPTGWFVGTGTGTISGTNVTVGDGSSSSGGSFNWGTSGNSDRALGSLASGSTRATEARFVNDSGSSIVSFTVTYTGEQWRQGGVSSGNNDLVMQYFDGTHLTAMGATFNFNTPYDAGPAGALNGNAASNRVTAIGGTYTPASPITNGQTFYLRWADADDFSTGNHGLGIDDLNITFTLITNANLSALTLSSGLLFSPAFDSNTVSYAASVANDITSVTVRPTSADPEATIEVRVNGGGYFDVNSGLPSHALALDVGPNTVEVRVTAQGGPTTKTYTLTVTRAASPPAVNTLPASDITPTNATLNGSINPNGLATTSWFQWGTTTNYGNETGIISLPASDTALAVSNEVAGLAPLTTYHFRVVATNSAGTNFGANFTFTVEISNIFISRLTTTTADLSWAGSGNLQEAHAVTGPWSNFPGNPVSPQIVNTTSGMKFFRIQFGTGFSANAVGYVNLSLQAGYHLIANPLNGTNNHLNTILSLFDTSEGTTVFRYEPGNQN